MSHNSGFFSSLIILALINTACTTGTALRTARVLEQGQLEFSGGLVSEGLTDVAQVLIGAYGITDRIEIEGRWEDNYIALTPRFQLLKSEKNGLDSLAFFEVGYNENLGFQCGSGIMVGKKWDYVEPYFSYRFRHFTSVSSHHKHSKKYWLDLDQNVQYLKLGSRFYFSRPNEKSKRLFIGLEAGPQFQKSTGSWWEYAANIGFTY